TAIGRRPSLGQPREPRSSETWGDVPRARTRRRNAMLRSLRSAAVIALATLFVAAACSPTSSGSATVAPGTAITVMSLWGGSEQDSFQKVLDAFKAKTGITANYESIRQDYATTLQTRISGGNPPDVAIIPGLGFP